jgi:Xaa-Pro aminopeptidase
MGLDTHDYGILTEPMQANMVFTVELEFISLLKVRNRLRRPRDSESGEPFNLMRNIPIEADEIESLMN